MRFVGVVYFCLTFDRGGVERRLYSQTRVVNAQDKDPSQLHRNPHLAPERWNFGIEDAMKRLFQIGRHDNKTFDSLLQVDKGRFDDSQ